jgi:ribosomal-protein-alanine N-acetyltransferase
MMTVTRLLSVDDAEEMAAVLAGNREFFAPWEPLRTDDFFTVQAQRFDLERALEAHARKAMMPLAIMA